MFNSRINPLSRPLSCQTWSSNTSLDDQILSATMEHHDDVTVKGGV